MTLLEHVLGALAEVPEVVVVGDEVVTSRPVTFVREDPAGGGPAAGLLAGLAGFPRPPRLVVVLAVDMPLVTTATVRRLVEAVGRRRCAARRRRRATAVPLRGLPHARRCSRPHRHWRSSTACRCGGWWTGCGWRRSRRWLGDARRRHLGRPPRAARAARRVGRSSRSEVPKEFGDTCCDHLRSVQDCGREPARLDRRALRRPRHRGRGGRGADPRPGHGTRRTRWSGRRLRSRPSCSGTPQRASTATRSRSSAWLAWPRCSRCAGTSRPRSSRTRTTTSRSRWTSTPSRGRGLTDRHHRRAPRVAACAPSPHPTRVVPRP